MYVSNRIASTSTSDSLAYLADKAAGKAVEDISEAASAAHLAGGSYDPSTHISLSVEALLVLSGARQHEEAKLPALTDDERNNLDTSALAEREYAAYGRYLETGDQKGYYRAYIEYFDSMPLQDQTSARYAGTRDAAVAGLRSFAYREKVVDVSEPDAVALFDVLLESDKTFRQATSAATVYHPGQSDFENAARLAGRISRATSMYATGF